MVQTKKTHMKRNSELASLRNRVKELEAENAKLLSQVSSCQCQQMEVKHDVLDSGNLVRRSRRGRKRADKSIPIHLISKRYVALKIMYFGKR
ncbi:BnaA02g33790D [Brassica napus]|uniref:BnaA02g33790D protein n=1 Tax=Brassica napus TaxID=3708 RepID=A0A078H1H8_BRANA|nr:BnaA02g33790D [Brassica napus]